MVGSGATAVASVILGRDFFGGDISQKRVNQALLNVKYAENGYYIGADCPSCGAIQAITRGRNGWSNKCGCPIMV